MGWPREDVEARTWTKALFPGSTAPREARDFVRSKVGTQAPSEAAVLLVSELVSNAVLHGTPGRAIQVRAGRVGDRIRVSVRNEGRFSPRPRRRPRDPGGWGLVLVQQVSASWGIDVGRGTTEVWFEVE